MGKNMYGNPVDINGKSVGNVAAFKKKYPRALVFDSMFELKCYRLLVQAKFNFIYHPPTRELAPSFDTWALSKGKSRKLFKSTVRSISYTSDFLILCNNGTRIYVEAKGVFQPDARMRYKLFQAKLEKNEITLLAYDKGGNTADMEAIIRIVNDMFEGSTKSAELVSTDIPKTISQL